MADPGRKGGVTPLPVFPKVSLPMMRAMKQWQTIAFDGDGSQPMRGASGNISRLKCSGDYQLKTVAIVDPVTCLSKRVLLVTRLAVRKDSP